MELLWPKVSVIVISGTWTPKVCNIMAFMAILMGLGLLFFILLGFRYKGPEIELTKSFVFFFLSP